MEILTAQQMRRIDRRAIATYGVPEIVLMENAGQAILRVLLRRYRPLRAHRFLLLCGRGNNGGDLLVVARHLLNREVPFEVLLVGSRSVPGRSAATNLAALRRAGVRPAEIASAGDWRRARRHLRSCDVAVDGLLGTGLSRPLSGWMARLVQDLNASGIEVVAVDIPSGLSGDTASVPGPCVRARATVTFARPKVPHLLPPASGRAGSVYVADIGIPEQAIDAEKVGLRLLLPEDLSGLPARRRRDSHKGDYGHALIVAGSRGKGGAARMTTLAALRSGCGLATAAIPASLQRGFVSGAMEAMTEPLAEDEAGGMGDPAPADLARLLQGKSAIAVGPGLGRGEGAGQMARTLVERARVPVVLDADGLNAFAGRASLLRRGSRPLVLTPHPGEMGRLAGMSTEEVLGSRLEVARDFARRHRCHVVLKGHRSLIAAPDGSVHVNPTGNPGMAKGGSGDVLTGILAGLLAQGLEVDRAVLLGVYLHGLAGDLAAAERGQAALLARDLLARLPAAFRRLGGHTFPEKGSIRRIA